jgi:Mn2+/Fe2+ NRAMP family transporter
MRAKRLLEMSLGVVTSVGGFLEVGSLATSAQAGARYRFALLWPLVLGTICLIFLIEMSGRLAAVSRHAIADAVRDRFGFNFFVVLAVVLVPLGILVLGAEIGGVCLALWLVTGIAVPWWAPAVALAVWLLLWKGTFGVIEQGTAILGLVTVAFLIAAIRLHPPLRELGAGLLPSWPAEAPAHYWFLAVTILGATLTPSMFYFYSSGAIEDRWDASYLGVNRVIAVIGMTFGGVLAAAVLVVSAMILGPRGIRVDQYAQVALTLTETFGHTGFALFVLSLAVACFGAALEVALATAYLVAQGLGWAWGENVKPRHAARYSAAYTIAVLLGSLLMVVGIDPLALTNLAMGLAAASLPLATVPFLILLNDRHYLGRHTNRTVSNVVVLVVIVLAFVLAVVSLPLQLLGG